MVREPRVSGLIHPVVGERPQNGDPPPSTLAAQLVQHFTNGTRRPKLQDHEAFRQLLLEVLGTAADQSGPLVPFENDVDINSKLIYVIVKAGLESPSSRNPFSNGSDSYQEVVDSLAALEVTINTCPKVLFVTSPNQEAQSLGSVQLYQWLFPRLLAFSAKPDILDGHKGIENLLKLCIMKEEKLQLAAAKHRPILAYLKGCTRGQSFPLNEEVQL